MSAEKIKLNAIREFCLQCQGKPKNVRLCENSKCPLFEFRFGKNPNRIKRKLSESQKQSLSLNFYGKKNTNLSQKKFREIKKGIKGNTNVLEIDKNVSELKFEASGKVRIIIENEA